MDFDLFFSSTFWPLNGLCFYFITFYQLSSNDLKVTHIHNYWYFFPAYVLYAEEMWQYDMKPRSFSFFLLRCCQHVIFLYKPCLMLYFLFVSKVWCNTFVEGRTNIFVIFICLGYPRSMICLESNLFFS